MSDSIRRRILFLLPITGFGGAESHSMTLARHFLALGDQPILAFPHTLATARLFQLCEEAGIETIDAPIAQSTMATPAENIAEQSMRLRQSVELADYDAVVVASPSPLTGAGILQALAGTDRPGICIFHLVPESFAIAPVAAQAMLSALRENFRFIAVSEFSRDMLCKALGLDPDDGFIEFIPNGSSVQIEDRDFRFQGSFLNPDLRAVVTVGRIHPQKGGEYLVRAVPLVLEQVPEARFLWFGEGPQQAELKSLAGTLGVSHAVHFPGFTSRAADLMRAADVVALPTLYEGLSLTLLEALHGGAAIVTTDASYQDRVITDGESGCIVPRRDPVELAAKIVAMLTDEALNRKCRSNALKLAEYYSESRMLDDYSRLMHQLVDGRSLPARSLASPITGDLNEAWITLREEGGDRFRLLASRNGSEPVRDLEGPALFARAMDGLAGSTRVGLRVAWEGHTEVWVEPRPVDPVRWRDASWAQLALDLAGHDGLHQSARRFALAAEVVHCLGAAPVGPVGLALLDSLLAFNAAHQLDLALSLAPLQHLRDPGLRRHYIERLCERRTAACFDAGERPDAALGLSRAERALLLEASARARGDAAGAGRYAVVRAALDGEFMSSKVRAGTPRVLFFAEYFNYPPVNGGDRRMVSLMQGYIDLGFEVFFCSFLPSRLREARLAQAAELRRSMGIESRYVVISDKYDAALRDAHAGVAKGENRFKQFYDQQAWRDLRALSEALEPTLIHVNYCYFAWVASTVDGLGSHRVLDMHDLISRRLDLNRELLRFCGDKRPDSVSRIPPSIHTPDRFAALRYSVLAEEIDALMQFDTVLSISPSEANTLRPLLVSDTIRTLEMHLGYSPTIRFEKERRYVRALYAGGNNLYNMIGAAALTNHVIPYLGARLRASDPGFRLRLTGDVGTCVTPLGMIELTGRIPDIDLAYVDVDLSLCPIPAGTGQNVKIVEALSHGIPVIAYRDLGRAANIIPGVNGELASTLSEFRELTLELIRNPARLVALRASTRSWAKQRFTSDRPRESLRSALESTGFDLSRIEAKPHVHEIRVPS